MTTLKPRWSTHGDPVAEMGRARMMVADLTMNMVMGRAARAARVDDVDGARPAVGPARGPVDLLTLKEGLGDGRSRLVTPIGLKTARVRLPRVLNALADSDGRRLVALRYMTLQELVTAPPVCADLNRSGGPRAGVPDGGAVYRAGLAEELRAYQGAIGSGTALGITRQRGRREAITDRALVDLVCLGGVELRGVLRAHGWSARAAFVDHLQARLFEGLRRMLDAIGLYG